MPEDEELIRLPAPAEYGSGVASSEEAVLATDAWELLELRLKSAGVGASRWRFRLVNAKGDGRSLAKLANELL